MGGGRIGEQTRRVNPESGGGERQEEGVRKGVNMYECIISISMMRGSGGQLNSLPPGVGVHVEDSKGGTTGRKKCLELLQEREMCVSQHPVSCG